MERPWQLQLRPVVELNVSLILVQLEVINDLVSARIHDVARCVGARAGVVPGGVFHCYDSLLTLSRRGSLELRHAGVLAFREDITAFCRQLSLISISAWARIALFDVELRFVGQSRKHSEGQVFVRCDRA